MPNLFNKSILNRLIKKVSAYTTALLVVGLLVPILSPSTATAAYSIGNDANDATIAVASNSTTNVNSAINGATKDLVVTGYPDTATVRAEVWVSTGAGTLKLSSLPASVETATAVTTGASRQVFYGSQANVNLALNNLQYISATSPSETLTASVISIKTSWGGASGDGYTFNPSNGHFYKLITPGTAPTWSEANTAITSNAATYSYQGSRGYLATITNATENTLIDNLIGTSASWLGGNDSANEGDWKWTAGPESGSSFWSGATGGSRVTNQGVDYSNWNTSEPNDSSGEDYLQMNADGRWNDLPGTYTLASFVVEFGDLVASGYTLLPQEKTRTVGVSILHNWQSVTNSTGTTNICLQSVDTSTGVSAAFSGGYCYLAFKSTATRKWKVPTGVSEIDYLVVAGGGGGGSRAGGGGGAGGLLTSTSVDVTGNSVFTISVGAGGAGGGTVAQQKGTQGSNSSLAANGGFTTITSTGGGGGGGSNSGGEAATTGGSGGGGFGGANGAAGTVGQGTSGGSGGSAACISTGATTDWCGGGGGGAASGGTTSNFVSGGRAGNGGAGASVAFITTSAASALSIGVVSSGSVYFAGGGGGGIDEGVPSYVGAGGIGGGGAGTSGTGQTPNNGLANTGGGGGGGGYHNTNGQSAGGAGGSGIVVLRYQVAVPNTPSNLVATTNNAGDAIALTWTAPTARAGVTIADYAVDISTNNFSTFTTINTGSTSASYTISSVTANTQYYIRVSALSSAGASDPTNIATPSTYALCSPTSSSVTVGGVSKTVVQFKSTGNCRWNAPAPLASAAADYLVVGGGASGTRGLCSIYWGSGGGGGAVVSGTSTFSGTVTISVGAGGAALSTTCNTAHTGNPGETSTVGVNIASAPGGRGGVSGTGSNTQVGGVGPGRVGGTSGNGYVGGTGTSADVATPTLCSSPGFCGAGGGGGAGGVGGALNGGVGVFSSITGSSVEYGSGGAGRDNNGTGTASGGGGDVGNSYTGEANTGGGGADAAPAVGAGGSGIVVIAYAGAPTITSVSPTGGSSAGGSITINGTNFAAGATAAIGSTALTSVTVVSATKITATVPSMTAGTYNVTVVSGGQTATLTNGYTARSAVNVGFRELNFDYTNHVNYPGGGRTAADCTATASTACTGKLQGDKVLFKNVYSIDGVSIDAIVTTETVTAGAAIQLYEVGTKAGGQPSYFETDIKITTANAYVSFKFEFYYAAAGYNYAVQPTDRATLENVNVTGIDIDYGQFNYFSNIEGYTRDAATRLTVTTTGTSPVITKFQGSTSIGSNDVKDQVVTNYSSFNTFDIVFGSTKADSSNNALFGVAFKALDWGTGTPQTTGGTTYTLAYNGNGNGSGSVPANQTGLVGQNMTVASNSGTLVRSGYTFNGWNTVADGSGTAYAAGSKYPMPKDGATLYAQWVGVSYTLAYNANSGTGAPANQTSNAGQSVTISATQPTRSGYTFTGWNDAIGGTGTSYAASGSLTMPASNITLYAQWSQITYTISYNANGGSGAPSSQTGASGSAQTISNTAPTWTGYTFGGWNTSAAGTGTSYLAGASTTMPVGGLTLYAKWTAITNYLLTYNANGGTGAPSPETRGASETFNLSATTPTRAGYTFAGWDAAANGSGTDYTASGSFTMSGANVSIYAKWTANTITVTYNGNTNTGGTAPSVQSGAYGETVTASVLGDLAKTGYSFNGWNTAAAGTGTSYLAGSTITLPVSNVTLYAQWSANSYTISYNANGGTGAPTSHSAATDSTVTAKAIGSMARTGYTFAGWDGAANGSGTDYTAGGTFTMPGNNLTLFAKWTVIPINISYALGTAGGTAVTGPTLPATASVNYSDTHTVGTLSSETVTVSSQIYAFAGWTTGSNTYKPGNSITAGTTNITMTATWVQLFRVKYLPNGGTPTSSTEDSECPSGLCTDNQAITLDASTIFTRAGYTFSKWTSQAGTDYDAGASKNISATEYLFYAKWTANNNTLSYNANGSDQTAPNNQTQATDSVATVASGITWAGYVFNGWNTAADGTGTSYAAARTFTMPASNVTLYAQWSALSYSVIYNANGGSNPPAVQSQSTGSTVTVAGVGSMVRPGYTFAEWDGAANGSGTDYTSAGTFTMSASNITLYAKWTINSYTFTYNVNGGTGGPAGSETGNTGSTVTVSGTDPTRTGYTFTGWNTSCDGTGTSYVGGATFAMPVGGGTLCAQWAPIVSYLITYFANGGTSAPSAQAEAENATATVSSAGSMSRTGHVFTGWNTAADGTGTARAVGATFTMPSSNVALYAQWSVSAYNLIYDVNGGSGSVATQTANSGATISVNATGPTRTGYTFISWTTVANGTGDSYAPAASLTIGAADVTLFAQWNINSFTLAYDANGGSNAPTSASTAFNATVTTAAVGSLTRSGYTFTGWNSAANGSGTNYIAGTTTFSMPAANVTLYAQWAPASFLLTYNANSGSGAPSAQGSLVDAQITVSASAPTRTGYTFAGWTENADGTGTAYAASSTFTMPPNNLTIYAKWTAITYTLTYAGNGNSGGAAPAVQTGTVGSSVATSAAGTLVKAGYTFTGWNTAANYSGTGYAVGRNYTFTASNVTLYAHWVADIYKLIYNANGGTTPPAAEEVATNANVTVPTVGSMTRPGYTFAGWTENADGTGTVYINGTGTATFTMPGAITTLYAKWTANNYEVVYFANTGTGTVPDTQTDSFTATVTIQEPTQLTKTNSVFTGWNTAADGTGTGYTSLTDITMPVGGLNLYAQWSGVAYTIAYNANGGSSAPAPQTGIAGTPVTLAPVEPVKPSSTFALWSVVPSGGSTTYSKGGVLTMPSSNLVLYAQWNAVVTPEPTPITPGITSYLVIYDANGANNGQTPADFNRYLPGATVTLLSNVGALGKTGFTFVGWNTKADGSGIAYGVDPASTLRVENQNVTLYAQWVVNGKYSLSYNGNGATGGTPPVDGEYFASGGKFVVKDNLGKLTLAGFVFNGWNTKADGTGTRYAPGATLLVEKTNVTLYAQWKALPTFTITFNGNSPTSGTAPVDSKKYLESEIAAIPDNTGKLVKTGYTFVGWNTKADGSGVSYPSGGAFKVGTTNLVLFAQWVKVEVPSPTSKNGQLKFETFYAMNSFFLDAKNRKVIETKIAAVKKKLTAKSKVTISIVGWVQPTRVSPNIKWLSTNRAQVVAKYMRKLGFKGTYILKYPGHDKDNIPSARHATVTITWTNSK